MIFCRQYDPDRWSISESLHSFIDVYMSPLYPLLRLISCILKHIYHYLYQLDRDDNVHLMGGTEDGEGARPIESLSIFVTLLILRYHFIFLSFHLLSLYFFPFLVFSRLFIMRGTGVVHESYTFT